MNLSIPATWQPFWMYTVGLTSLVTVAKDSFLLRMFVFKPLLLLGKKQLMRLMIFQIQ